MKLADFERFKKVMMLTTSPVDAEALAALRKANEVLAANGKTWCEVLDRVVKVESEIEPAEDQPTDASRIRAREIDDMFDEVEASDPRGSFADFIADIKRQWNDVRWLSAAQVTALKNAADRARKR